MEKCRSNLSFIVRLSPVAGEISPRHVSSHSHSHPTPPMHRLYSHFSLLHVSFSFPDLIISLSFVHVRKIIQ
jgi:hypothetical protein